MVKKLNNKGFAISTILYGLLVVIMLITSLLMSTMAFSRKNSKDFVDNVKKNFENEFRVIPSVSIANNNGNVCYVGEECNATVTLDVYGENIEIISDYLTFGTAAYICKNGEMTSDWIQFYSIKSNKISDNHMQYFIENLHLSTTEAGVKYSLKIFDKLLKNTVDGDEFFSKSIDVNLGTIEEVNQELITYNCKDASLDTGGNIQITCNFTKDKGNYIQNNNIVPKVIIGSSYYSFDFSSFTSAYYTVTDSKVSVTYKICYSEGCKNDGSKRYIDQSLPPYWGGDIDLLIYENSFSNNKEITVNTNYSICLKSYDNHSCSSWFVK